MPETPLASAPKDRLVWVDALRLMAGLSMVGLHATADANGQPWPDYPVEDRVLPMLLRAVIYTARTELFLIISVFLLLMALDARPKSYGQTMSVQARRLLVPFAFWTGFYALYGLIKADAFGYLDAAVRELQDPVAWLGYVTLGSVKYHMHFIPTLFGLLLFFPLFRLAQRHPFLGLMVLACLLIKRELDGFIYPTFWGEAVLPYLVRSVKILTYVGYGLVAGSCLGLWQRQTLQARARFFPLLLFFGALLFLFKLIATYKTIETGQWPFSYTAGYWADFLMPVALFGLCMSLAHKQWPPVLSRLAPFSFGIYLCHPIFLDLAEIALRDSTMSPMALIAIKMGCTVSATCLFVYILSRLRALAWTIGLGPLPSLAPKFVKRPS